MAAKNDSTGSVVWHDVTAWTRAVEKAYRAGNDAGEGFAPDSSSDDVNEHGEEFGDLVSRSGGDRELAVYWDGERLVAVGDAHGCWAVDVSSVREGR